MSLANSLYIALTHINVPSEQALKVVEALELKMTNDFAIKSDIELLHKDISAVRTELNSNIEALRADTTAEFAAVRAEMNAEFAAVRAEMKAEFAAVRAEMKTEFAAVRAEMKAELAAVRSEIDLQLSSLRSDMKALENRLTMRLGALMVILMGVMPQITAWLGW